MDEIKCGSHSRCVGVCVNVNYYTPTVIRIYVSTHQHELQLRSNAILAEKIENNIDYARVREGGSISVSSLSETYPNRADSSAVAAVGILFLSLEQNGGE